MMIVNTMTDDAVLNELGERLARRRLERNLTQTDLAHEAGVSTRTISLAEGGQSITMGSLVRILRALELLDGLNQVLPASGPSPIEMLERGGKLRARASRPRSVKDDDADSSRNSR